jgi:inorganic phosphate transporter, PiT family
MLLTLALIGAAGVLAIVYGSNAGSTIVSIGLTIGSVRVWIALVGLAIGVAVAPALVGTAVATTVADELVTLDGPAGQLALLCAVVSALVITAALSRLGLPTSLTLALLGGITGVGIGAGLPVSWGRILTVLGGMAVAPVLGGVIAYLLRLALGRAYFTGGIDKAVSRAHLVLFSVLVFAFGANDGQKILAVFAVAFGPVDGEVPVLWPQLICGGVLFAIGAGLGLRRMARGVNRGVIVVRPFDAVIVESSTAAVMLASSVVGNPAGMAQTLSGSLIGTGLIGGRRRIRWPFAVRIANAWLVTLPATFVSGLALGWLTSGLFADFAA